LADAIRVVTLCIACFDMQSYVYLILNWTEIYVIVCKYMLHFVHDIAVSVLTYLLQTSCNLRNKCVRENTQIFSTNKHKN